MLGHEGAEHEARRLHRTEDEFAERGLHGRDDLIAILLDLERGLDRRARDILEDRRRELARALGVAEEVEVEERTRAVGACALDEESRGLIDLGLRHRRRREVLPV